MQVNTWVSGDSSQPSLPTVRCAKLREEHLSLEDVHTDEDKLNGSMLSSDSTHLPFTSDVESQTIQSDSEDETETFEPDSLAPTRPAQPRKHSTNGKNDLPPVDTQERKTHEEEVISGEAATVLSPEIRVSAAQNDLETPSDCVKVEMKEAPKQEDAWYVCQQIQLDGSREGGGENTVLVEGTLHSILSPYGSRGAQRNLPEQDARAHPVPV